MSNELVWVEVGGQKLRVGASFADSKGLAIVEPPDGGYARWWGDAPAFVSDSGWRDLSAEWGASAGQIQFRRLGNIVQVRLNPNDAAWPDNTGGGYPDGSFLPDPDGRVPVGFRPNATVNVPTEFINGDELPTSPNVPWFQFTGAGDPYGEGKLLTYTNGANSYFIGSYHGSAVWVTDEAWPGSLPGTMVTPPAVLDPDNGIAAPSEADTGWRNLDQTENVLASYEWYDTTFDASLVDNLNPGWPLLKVRRIGNRVLLGIDTGFNQYGTITALAGFSTAIVPEGFRPTAQVSGVMWSDDVGTGPKGHWELHPGGALHAYSMTGEQPDGMFGVIEYTTDEPWPTTLPGTAFTQARSGYNGPASAASSGRDSGWHLLPDPYGSDGTARVLIRRKGDIVSWIWQGDALEDYTGAILTEPGLRPPVAVTVDHYMEFAVNGAIVGGAKAGQMAPLRALFSGGGGADDAVDGPNFYPVGDHGSYTKWSVNNVLIEYVTDDAWPESFPGTPL